MRQVSLRQFRIRGARALETVPEGEIVLLAGRKGPAYFLVPVLEDVPAEDRELRRAMVKAGLRRNWRLVGEGGAAAMDEVEIDREINLVRQRRMSE